MTTIENETIPEMEIPQPLIEPEPEVEPDSLGGLDDDDEVLLTLVSQEGDKVIITQDEAKHSWLIKTAIENEENTSEMPLSLPTKQLNYIVEILKLMNKYDEVKMPPKPLKSNKFSEIKEMEAYPELRDYIWNFLYEHGKQELYDLYSSCNYVDIKVVINLIAGRIACMIKGSSLEHIKEIMDPNVSLDKYDATKPLEVK